MKAKLNINKKIVWSESKIMKQIPAPQLLENNQIKKFAFY